MSQVISTDRNRFKRYWEQQAIQCAAHQQWAEAEKINRSIVKLWPEDVDAHNRLGKALWEMGLLREAKDTYRRALDLDPVNANHLSALRPHLPAPMTYRMFPRISSSLNPARPPL